MTKTREKISTNLGDGETSHGDLEQNQLSPDGTRNGRSEKRLKRTEPGNPSRGEGVWGRKTVKGQNPEPEGTTQKPG